MYELSDIDAVLRNDLISVRIRVRTTFERIHLVLLVRADTKSMGLLVPGNSTMYCYLASGVANIQRGVGLHSVYLNRGGLIKNELAKIEKLLCEILSVRKVLRGYSLMYRTLEHVPRVFLHFS